jgi:hypothetical protein
MASMHPGLKACWNDGVPTDAGKQDGEVGARCKGPADCRTGMCLDFAGDWRCSDLCCSDDSCGDPSLFVCRPGLVGIAWALRCEPK